MKRAAAAALLLLLALALFLARAPRVEPPGEAPLEPAAASSQPVPDPEAAAEIAAVHAMLANLLTLVKDPYRPPLGDNADITRALSGGNRLGETLLAGDDPRVADGRIVDRWGTPYHFHPRAPDAIDVRSAGPDRILFTADDIVRPPARPGG